MSDKTQVVTLPMFPNQVEKDLHAFLVIEHSKAATEEWAVFRWADMCQTRVVGGPGTGEVWVGADTGAQAASKRPRP